MVESKSSSFVAAQNIHSCHFLNGCHPFSDSTLQNSTTNLRTNDALATKYYLKKDDSNAPRTPAEINDENLLQE